ncbi:MAG: hypothetical protein SFV55_11840 [Haliscomenobacter sp.]|uniref:hypothetical protein n=1 Tax=Haliscomenobacter sp. TaxID=2717303 RepID=UPI0029AC61CE|nr:hypothetical protein [Haliscomenobacter sp.]MDX2069104.1 hypothetical protein [Haliscomenobacter sp.]
MKKIIFFLMLSVFFFASCETEIVEEIDEFAFENGGYMRTVTPYPVVNNSTFKVSKANMSGTKMELVAEAVTPNAGALFSSYDLEVRFVDATPLPAGSVNNSKAYIAFKSYAASAYAKDATTGYPRATLSATGKEMQDKLGLTDDQITSGDRFEIRATMKLTNGKSFNATNSGANLTGAFYSSPFFYQVNVVN